MVLAICKVHGVVPLLLVLLRRVAPPGSLSSMKSKFW